jgi:hypothetical protein
MNCSQPEHDEFARLPRKDREAVYQLARKKVGVQEMVTVSLMLEIHRFSQKGH